MKKMALMAISLMLCLYLAGCGSPDRNQQDREQLTAQAAGMEQENGGQKDGTQLALKDTSQECSSQAAENTLAAGQAQTEWDGEEEDESDTAGISADPETPEPKPEDGDGSKYQADFLGNDSNNMKSCIIYHNGKKEALNLSTAKGKYFIQMLSGFFGEYEEGYAFFDGGMDLEWLEEVSQEKLENYYIKLQIENPVTMTFQEIYPDSESTRTVEGYDTLIIGANMDPESDYLALFWNDGTDTFWGVAPNKGADPDFMDDFQAKYKSWEETTDWEKAFTEIAEGK